MKSVWGKRNQANAFASLIRGAKSASAIDELHSRIVKDGLETDTYLGNNLVRVFGRCGRIDRARSSFERIAEKSVFSWTIIISAYVQNGHSSEALALFRRMEREGVKANEVTLTAVLGACATLKSLSVGRSIHSRLAELKKQQLDVVTGNALVNMYSKCGSLRDARAAFDETIDKDVVSWTSMITAYAENGRWSKAVRIFWKMVSSSGGSSVSPNEVTCLSVLGACSSAGDLSQTKSIHRHIAATTGFDRQLLVGNTLVFTYGRCGSPGDARSVFDRMRRRNAVTWASMIGAYAHNDEASAAVELFSAMNKNDRADEVTYLSVLEACSKICSLQIGRDIHLKIVDAGFEDRISLATAVMAMYGRCGSLVEAKGVFDRMPVRNVVAWNVIMEAYTQSGEADGALDLFKLSCLDGVSPDVISFVTVLFACSHAGMIREGCRQFGSMGTDFGVESCLDHYVCVVDLLGRSGWAVDAERFVMTMMPERYRMQFVPWMALLAPCKVHGEVTIANRVYEQLRLLESSQQGVQQDETCASMVMLSNLYSDLQ